MQSFLKTVLVLALFAGGPHAANELEAKVTRVFIFAGQSNMVGSDSKASDIEHFPPFAGLDEPQSKVKFSYMIGREHKLTSDGWAELAPVDEVVGPELSFARKVASKLDGPVAIIKCAAGGTHLGGDWNPDEPAGFQMYPLLLELVRSSLAELDKKRIPYQVEGFFWHQGENDMFEDEFLQNYGANLANFVAKVRRDLECPKLRFYVGELCTKTVWGMDLRSKMYAISLGQKEVAANDSLVDYVPTSHVGVEIGGGAGLHYHYGTLGQLEHGVNYADAYLATQGLQDFKAEPLAKWPHKKGKTVQLFVLAGHRNMEGERAFTQELRSLPKSKALLKDNVKVPFRYSLGGGYKVSNGWEPLGPRGYYDTFGPELSFGRSLQRSLKEPLAIAKFTHSGSQIIDWTPEGSEAKSRNLYPDFIAFIEQSIEALRSEGNRVELAGIFYHVGENDMSFYPYREQAAARVEALILESRKDLKAPNLPWYISQQPPTDDEAVNQSDVTARLREVAAKDEHTVHIYSSELPKQSKKLVLDTAAIVALGELLAKAYLDRK
ncbi:MAG: hypothetical protein ACJAZ8_001477 [Planctomycetota bacterium]|jgi:hypothetical protein